jgi:hypothetical protein
MPQINPDSFVPTTLKNRDTISLSFGTILAVFILVYAFALLPVAIMFTIKKYSVSPYALVLACSLIGISLIIEIVNNLPLIVTESYPVQVEHISTEMLLYLRQIETLRYLAFDVAGFTLAYVAIFVYALVYFKTHRLFSYMILSSIILFIVNIPFLWIAPNMAIILMSLSIFAFATVPIFLARQAVN